MAPLKETLKVFFNSKTKDLSGLGKQPTTKNKSEREKDKRGKNETHLKETSKVILTQKQKICMVWVNSP